MAEPTTTTVRPEAVGHPVADAAPARDARSIVVEGVVQGVGFRPFVWRLGHELGLDGVVRNAAGRVEIDVAGAPDVLDAFAARLRSDAPPRARVERVTVTGVTVADSPIAPSPVGGPLRPGAGFAILESVAAASSVRLFPPDIATCDDCLRELFDPTDRRYRYPFTNCTNCGPRATIIDELPYDRARTSMRDFPLCPDCEREYRDPADRRFHAEPVACPACGPGLAFRTTGDPAPTAAGEAALAAALDALGEGRIVAVKGLGGYHLACDATDDAAVARLRDRKRRWAKPFAVMVRDLDAARAIARIPSPAAELLRAPARPIVLLDLRKDGFPTIAPAVVAGNRRIGLFLPYTPLHHLLLEGAGVPLVLTSGNLADEPLVTDDDDALDRLAGLADAFLMHDREIRARYDDSVTRIVGVEARDAGAPRASIIRRGRGYAPEPVSLPVTLPDGAVLLAAGAELKHTFALAAGDRAHVGPHIGDLEDLATHRAFQGNLAHLERLLALDPGWVAHDLHPAYLSSQYAVGRFPSDRRLAIQHHHAHVASCAAEHGLIEPFLGVAYDGLGMGDDGTFWGGELLVADLVGYRRFARFGLAPMPGGAAAVHKPYRMALGYLFGAEADGVGEASSATDRAFRSAIADGAARRLLDRLDPREIDVVRTQIERDLNAPLASSAGRLFDAVSSLLGIRDVAEYEAQAAIDLEMAATPGHPGTALPYRLVQRDGLLVFDPRPTLLALLDALGRGSTPAALAGRFQSTVVAATRELCAEARAATGIGTVCLSGGVLQNRTIADALLDGLTRDGARVHINEQVPVNDGGICLGQAAVAAGRLAGRTSAIESGTAAGTAAA